MTAHAFTPQEHAAHFGDAGGTSIDMIESEQSVIGALLMNNDTIGDMPDTLQGACFQEQIHGEIYDEIKRLHSMGRRADAITVKSAISTQSIGDVSISTYMARMMGSTLGPTIATQLAPEIVLAHYRREIADIGRRMAGAAFRHELDFAEEIEALHARIAEIRAEMAGARDGVKPGDAYIELFNRVEERGEAGGVPIAIPALRKVLEEDTFASGNIYALLGASGEGKTATTLQLIYGALKAGHPVQFLSYDQSKEQCVRQMIAQVHEIGVKQQSDPRQKMTESERDKCMIFADWLNRQPLEIIRCRREGIAQLLAYAKRFIKRSRNGKTPLIVIDHILKVKPRDPRASPDIRSSDINMEAKAFADEHGAAILILNQRNGQGGYRINPRPIGKDLYGGEGAKQDYDGIAYIYRPEHWRGEMMAASSDDRERTKIAAVFAEFAGEDVAEFGTLKVRFGQKGIRALARFIGRYTRYDPMETREQELF